MRKKYNNVLEGLTPEERQELYYGKPITLPKCKLCGDIIETEEEYIRHLKYKHDRKE